MPTFNSFFINGNVASNIGWIDSMPGFAAPVTLNLFGSMARITNSDGTWTVFHGDIGGFSLDAQGHLVGTIRWMTRTTAGAGFGDAVELQAYGGAFDHLNIPALTLLGLNTEDRFNTLFGFLGLTLNGDAGNNLLGGGLFGDAFNGFGGSDTVSYRHAQGGILADLTGAFPGFGEANGDIFSSIENLTGSSFSDRLFGDANANTLNGRAGGDVLTGRGGDDVLNGDSGDDTLIGGLGNDILNGGLGRDLLSYRDTTLGVSVTIGPLDSGTVQAGGGFGTDIFNQIEDIEGGAGNDTLVGNAEVNQIYGGDGNDAVAGDFGNDTIYGGLGNDLLAGGAGLDTIYGGGGRDTVTFTSLGVSGVSLWLDESGNGTAVVQTGGNDTVSGIAHLTGSIGNDNLQGNAGANRLDGGLGNDRLYGRAGNDLVRGGDGADVLFGDDDWDFQDGRLAEGDDTLDGGADNDTLIGGNGTDMLIGGLGRDVADYSRLFDDLGNGEYSIHANLATGQVTKYFYDYRDQGFMPFAIDSIVGSGADAVENVVGTAGNDVITGSELNNTFYGGFGKDTLSGGGGDDVLAGGAGMDQMFGGAGNDRFYIDTTDVWSEGPNGGIDTIFVSTTHWLAADFENLTLTGSASVEGHGNAGANIIIGNAGANLLFGGGGADRMIGGAGNDGYYSDSDDTLVELANGGIDTVFATATAALAANIENLTLFGEGAMNGIGNNLANKILGANGNNALNGRQGLDTLTGGLGVDHFLFNTALGPTNVDRITDFAVGVDRILLDDAIFTGLTIGALAANAFLANSNPVASSTTHRIIYETDTGFLWYDANGSGGAAAVHFATLNAGLAVAANIFNVF